MRYNPFARGGDGAELDEIIIATVSALNEAALEIAVNHARCLGRGVAAWMVQARTSFSPAVK